MMIATQLFGRSGHMSTRTIFGAAALSHVTQQEADQTLELLLHYGVNHIDVASSYGDADMRIDSVDLWQLHSLADPIEWDTALSTGGALDAAIEARKQGLVRAIGVTGHGLQIAD